MKLVVDTNLLLSGLLWPGTPSLLLHAILDGHARLVLSTVLLDEFNEVVHRTKFTARIQMAQTSREELMATIRDACEIVIAAPIPAPLALRDPG